MMCSYGLLVTSVCHACDLSFTVSITLRSALETFLCCAATVEIVDPPLFSYFKLLATANNDQEVVSYHFFLTSFASRFVFYFRCGIFFPWVAYRSEFVVIFFSECVCLCVYEVSPASRAEWSWCVYVERLIAATCQEFHLRACIAIWGGDLCAVLNVGSSHPHMPINTFTFFYNVWKEEKKNKAEKCPWPLFSSSIDA